MALTTTQRDMLDQMCISASTSQVGTAVYNLEQAQPTGTVVGTTDTQTLTNKTLTSPKVNEDVVLSATSTELDLAVTKSTYGMRMYYLGTPELDDDDQVVTTANMKVGTYTVDASPDVPRVITVTHTSVGATDTLGTLTITGTDYADTVITEVITPLADTTVTGTKAFKTVSGIDGADWVIAEGNDTITVGTGPALGLPEVVAVSTTNAYAKLALVDEAISAVGTHADLATTTATLTSALNGASVYIQTNA